MVIDIFNVPKSTISNDLKGKLIGIYGTNNTGKSYVSSKLFPGKTLWIATEKGFNAISNIRPISVNSWQDFRTVVSQLSPNSEAQRAKVSENYDCVVVDVADRLPDLCSAYIVNQYNVKGEQRAATKGEVFSKVDALHDIPYGNGTVLFNTEMGAQINKLCLSGLCVVLLFHDETKILKHNNGTEYTYTFPKNTSQKAGRILRDLPDFFIYLQSQGVDENGSPILSVGYCAQHESYFARSRFTECATSIRPFTVENLKKTIADACEKEAEKNGETLVSAQENLSLQTESEITVTLEDAKKKLEPLVEAMKNAKCGKDAKMIIKDYLGDGKRISDVQSESDTQKLLYIYNDLVDYMSKNNISYELG